MNTSDNVRMAKMIKVRTIQSKMVKTAKIIKLFHRKTQNHPGRRMLKMAKTGIKGNKKLIWATLASAALMLGILLIPALRHVFSIPVLPVGNILEIVVLSLMPLIVVELFKLIKINTSKSEKL